LLDRLQKKRFEDRTPRVETAHTFNSLTRERPWNKSLRGGRRKSRVRSLREAEPGQGLDALSHRGTESNGGDAMYIGGGVILLIIVILLLIWLL
jgi:hypothetical protein